METEIEKAWLAGLLEAKVDEVLTELDLEIRDGD